MPTFINASDTVLQSLITRTGTISLPDNVLLPGLKRIELSSDNLFFKIAVDGTVTPQTITFTAFLVELTGTVTFSIVTGTGTLTNITATTCQLTYANATSDNIAVRATITESGTTYTDTVFITKVRDGGVGTSPSTYWMNTSTTTIVRNTDGTIIPNSLTAQAYQQVGSSLPVLYYGRFIFETSTDGTNYTAAYTSSNDENLATYNNIPNSVNFVRTKLFLSGSTTTLVDTEAIPVLEEGVAYDVEIESSNGVYFRPGQGIVTTLIAHVFRNGVDVTSSISESKFRWRRVSYYSPNDDVTWNQTYSSGYKQITVSIQDVTQRATFHCDILE